VANHPSAQKRARQTIKRALRNKHVRTEVRTLVKRVRAALASGKRKDAVASLQVAVRKIDMAVSKGVLPRNAGSRYIGRLSSQVAALKK